MTQEIARIVGGIVSSNRMFSLGEDEVWLPFSDDVFEITRHVARALSLHGYDARPTRGRVACGTTVKVDGAESISHQERQGILEDTYGYSGRIPGLMNEGLPYDADPIEPGNILEIPHVGWTGENSRIVIGRYSGTYMAKLHRDNIEVYPDDGPLEMIRGDENNEGTTLGELFDKDRVIVKKPEWTGYSQQTYH